MNTFSEIAREQPSLDLSVLAHVWEEDGVWNISAFDLPIVAYGENLHAARSHFEEAVASHFETLRHVNRLNETVTELSLLAEQRNFWRERATPETLVQMFKLPSNPSHQLCAV